MDLSYDVRVHKTDVYTSRRKNGPNTYWVRWQVEGKRFKEPFKQSALADSFRSDLVAAARKGEAFRVLDGLPVSKARHVAEMGWFEFACKYVDMRWPRVAATTRRTHAEAMTAVTTAMFADRRGMPDEQALRSALSIWAFNKTRRDQCGESVKATLRWAREHSLPVSALRDPATLRRVLDALALRLDGKEASGTVVRRKRSVLSTALEYAVQLGLLDANPVPALKWSPPATTTTVDRRRVASPIQVRTLLGAIKTQQRTGDRLVAFFGCLYFAALRPEEAVALRKEDLALPDSGWGELLLERAEPYAGPRWTDDGASRDVRGLKHRARGESRVVPCPPELTELLHQHLDAHGTGPDGRLFRGERNANGLPKITIRRAWQRARGEVFTPEVYVSTLARTPYDLRHAAVSTWLNGGVPPTTVAEWAGHSVDVLLGTYAKCLDGTDAAVRRRVQDALGHVSSR